MTTVVLLGERVNDRLLSDRDVAGWERRWRQDPVRCILRTPAMARGRTRERLFDLIAMKPGRVRLLNLLPPDNKPGTWDEELAEYCAVHLLSWLSRGEHDWRRLFMLGKRISRELTDRSNCEFGETYDLCGLPALCFPHPSGRSRWLNGDEYKAKARLWARQFMRGI